MRSLLIAATLASTLFLGAGPARASSYQTVFGTIVDPIQSRASGGGPHPYSGPNLEPFVSTAGANLSFAVLYEADLFVADLRFVNLVNADLDRANLDFALLIDALLFDTRLVDASLMNTNLSGANLTNAIVGRADLRNANLTDANLAGANLLQSDLRNANLTDADLTGTSLNLASLEGATLVGAFYDENTIFPSGNFYDMPPWDIDAAGTSPWDAGMIPSPEPSIGWMLVFGLSWVAGLARWRRGAVGRTTRLEN